MKFPTLIIDDFLDDPDLIRHMALSMDYAPAPTGFFPGKRTGPLHLIEEQYFNYFCHKLFRMVPGGFEDWKIDTYFQLIDPFINEAGEIDPDLNWGWVHTDGKSCDLAGILYLNPTANLDAGTSVFRSATPGIDPPDIGPKREFFKTNKGNKAIADSIKNNRAQFTEVTRINNVYNRLAYYDGQDYHAAGNLITGPEPRLTQVFFARKI